MHPMETRQVRSKDHPVRCIKHFHPAYSSAHWSILLVACEKKEARPLPVPPAVKVVDVVQQDVPIYFRLGRPAEWRHNAEIMPKVQGYVLSQNYQDGFPVKRTSFSLKSIHGPLRRALDQANAQIAVAEADLASAEPTWLAIHPWRPRTLFP